MFQYYKMSLNTSDIERYFQFCEYYQYICNNMIQNQQIMSNNLYNLINNGFRRRPLNTFVNNNRFGARNNNFGFRRRQRPGFRNRLNSPLTMPTTVPSTSPMANTTDETRTFVFPLNLNNFENDLNNGVRNIFNELLNNTQNNSFFENIPVVPTQEQINNACEFTTYSQDISGQQTCPISLARFNDGQEVMRIRHCGHIFIREFGALVFIKF